MPQNQETVAELVARIDERTRALDDKIAALREELKTATTNLADKIEDNVKDHDGLKKTVTENYVRNESFNPVQRVVYGIVSIILTAVVIAVVGLVVLK